MRNFKFTILGLASALALAACSGQPVWTESPENGKSIAEQVLEIVGDAIIDKLEEVEADADQG